MSDQVRQSAAWLAQELATHFASVLEAMSGHTPTTNWSDQPVSPSDDELWWEQPFSSLGGAALWVGASKDSWRTIGALILEEAGVDASDEDARGTYHETIAQVLSSVARSLTQRLGREVLAEGGTESSSRPSLALHCLEFRFPSGKSGDLQVAFGNELLSALAPAPSPAPASAPASVPPAAVPTANGSKTIDLLLDVELPVSISFGRANLPLKDVVKLSSGSIVELNRTISEPVEIIVNNCVIARGEVVVIDGNYGVKIKQIISRQERLRTLH